MSANAERAQRAEMALAAYQGRDAGDTLADNIVDLIVDLLHLARQNGIEPDYIIHMAQMHFDAEVEEEAGQRAPDFLSSLRTAAEEVKNG